MRAKTRRAEHRNRRTRERQKLVRHIVYVLNLLFGIVTNGCELTAFGGHWLAPDNLAAPNAGIERMHDNMRLTSLPHLLECPAPSLQPPAVFLQGSIFETNKVMG